MYINSIAMVSKFDVTQVIQCTATLDIPTNIDHAELPLSGTEYDCTVIDEGSLYIKTTQTPAQLPSIKDELLDMLGQKDNQGSSTITLNTLTVQTEQEDQPHHIEFN